MQHRRLSARVLGHFIPPRRSDACPFSLAAGLVLCDTKQDILSTGLPGDENFHMCTPAHMTGLNVRVLAIRTDCEPQYPGRE